MSDFSSAIREFLAAPEQTRRIGPYRCTELLDVAGTAPVYRAVEEHGNVRLREVAIKLFDIGPARSGDEGAADATSATDRWQARVVDEARSLCRVQHPNVIRFHTLVTDPTRGLMGLVMEFAEGTSLDKELAVLPVGDPRRVALTVQVGVDAASALGAAHEANVVHCNVKPSNVMFTGGTHKLINFGIAASLRQVSRGEARTGLALEDLTPESVGRRASMLVKDPAKADAPSALRIAGTVGYVDPVCVRTTAPPTTTSDLYSLGATLYECAAGDVPALATAKHRGGAEGVRLDPRVLSGDAPPVPLAEIAPSVPPELAKLIDALVAPSPDARPRSADAVRRAMERIRSALAGRARALPPEERGPFPGLERYEASDRDVFFGRSAETAGVLELLRTRGLVALVGSSAAGKSSLLRAGLVPALEEGALGGWPATYRSVLVTPGGDLMAALDAALSKVLGAPLAEHPEAIAEQLAADVDAKGEGLVLVVDQLEELVIKHDTARDPSRGEGRLRALGLLSRLAEAPTGVRAIVAVRRDVLDDVLAVDPHFARAMARGTQLLGPLTGVGWEEVLDQALDAYGYRFEDAALRKDVLVELRDREAAMTLAQFGLLRLWAARDAEKKTLTRAGLDGLGEKTGMRGALAEHAGQAIAKLAVPREKVQDIVLAFTTPEGTRAHASLEALEARFGAQARDVVFALTKARMVVSEKQGFTFVHDSVLRDWGLLRGWIDEARGDRLLLAHLERDAARWTASRDSAELWRKSRLAAAIDLWKRGGASLSDDARAFVRKSSKEEEKVKLAFFTLAALVVFLVVGSSLVYAKENRDHAAEVQKSADALAAALEEVKALKHQAEENALEAAATAALIQELQAKVSAERAAYGAQVQATLKKVASATNLDTAQKATADLKTSASPASGQVVPLPANLLAGPGGPKLDTSGPSPSAGSGAFDQSAIERVVNARKAGVKRTCLERSASTASSTKITATLTIAPSGAVQSVATAGDDPVVGKCIEQQLRNWSFPAPGETKEVQIPFVFVRQ